MMRFRRYLCLTFGMHFCEKGREGVLVCPACHMTFYRRFSE